MARWHALWLKPQLAPEIEREVNIERLRLMARQQGLSAGAHTLNSLMLAAAAWPAVDNTLLLAAIIPFQGAALWQLWLWWTHRHRRRPSARPPSTTLRSPESAYGRWCSALCGAASPPGCWPPSRTARSSF